MTARIGAAPRPVCVARFMLALLLLSGAAWAFAAAAHDAAHAPSQIGIASVYAKMLEGRTTASGDKHQGEDYVAAHRTLPLGTNVRVTNLANHRSVVVRINDRGPRLKSRIIDLSPSAAAQIGLRAHGRGVARVRLDVLPDSAGHEPEGTKP